MLRDICLLLFLSLFSFISFASDKTYSPEDFQHFLDTARIAQATYGGEQELDRLLTEKGYQIEILQQAKGFSVAYVLATNRTLKKHLIAIRGTANANNVIADAAFVLVKDNITGIDIHQGFLLSARDIFEDVMPRIRPGYKIDTIGHSLGGAAALVIAMMFDKQGYSIDEVITFGQPKVTNINGSSAFSHLNVTRLVTPKDIVPLVPPVDPMDMMNFSIFWHQGTEIVLADENRYSVLTGIKSMMRASSFLNDMPSDVHITNHFMSSYIESIQKKVTDPLQVAYKSDFNLRDWFTDANEKKIK